MSNLEEEEPRFHGVDGSEAERFVSAIRRKALALDKQSDNAWLAAYAASCMDGNAVRWYETLDDDVQDDWKLLRRALLERWPATRSEISSNIPTPAAAAPPRPVLEASSPSQLTSVFQNLSVTKPKPSVVKGRLRLIADESNGSGYVSKYRDSWGHYNKCGINEPDKAIQVEISSNELFLDSSSGERLGVTWPSLHSTDWIRGASNRAKLVSVYPNGSCSSRADVGTTQCDVWKIDQFVQISYKDNSGAPHPLELVIQDPHDRRHHKQAMRLVVSAANYMGVEPNSCRAYLVFEPVKS